MFNGIFSNYIESTSIETYFYDGYFFFDGNMISEKVFFINEFGVYNAITLGSGIRLSNDGVVISFMPSSSDKIVSFNIITQLFYTHYIKKSKYKILHSSYNLFVSELDINNRENKFNSLLND